MLPNLMKLGRVDETLAAECTANPAQTHLNSRSRPNYKVHHPAPPPLAGRPFPPKTTYITTIAQSLSFPFASTSNTNHIITEGTSIHPSHKDLFIHRVSQAKEEITMTSIAELNKNGGQAGSAGRQDVVLELEPQVPHQEPPHPPPVYSLTKSSDYQVPQPQDTQRSFDSVDLEAQTVPHRHPHSHQAPAGLDEPEQNPDEKRSSLRLRGGCCCCDCLYDLLRCLLCCCIFEAICDMCC
ncbi:uncharacterized protein PGTG_01755 [Puccinia graminis f. sp. tritici CRL 75-36-700-3]|uniref:Uncharacterized protein n=2 Tax=Puccinia graminis f. sp. tritici TaxID=56615 RepID=E3JSY7_PUCGT|nr:uncharacterized protein PGTG_01755 [Puccinia graminis f. sp. tritici CRL 75-36-700-3]EFP75162.2 hypothetical protein PGTG_01755 [Puccinia graminis f. sp. tritici CRL 75-36-700-3]